MQKKQLLFARQESILEERQTQFIDKLSVTLKSTFPFFPFFALTKHVLLFFWPHRDAIAVVVVAMPIVGVNGSVFGVCVPFKRKTVKLWLLFFQFLFLLTTMLALIPWNISLTFEDLKRKDNFEFQSLFDWLNLKFTLTDYSDFHMGNRWHI